MTKPRKPTTADSFVPPRGNGSGGSSTSHRESRRHRHHDNLWNTTAASIPRWTNLSIKSVLGMTVVLIVLNQKALLPKPLAAVVSKVLFWPTLPITVGLRLGKWSTEIDDTVVMGGAPFGFAGIPETLYQEYGIRGVINMCDEYEGPTQQYKELGITQLRLPVVDHFTPDLEALEQAVRFIQQKKMEGKRVYVHCRAGHGRSAAAVFAWLLYKEPNVDRQNLNQQFCRIRYVKSTLWRQPSVMEFHSRLLNGQFTTDDRPR